MLASSALLLVIWLVLIALVIIPMWVVFTKAGQPGWASIIPIYNAYVLLLIAGKPGWWLVLMLVPGVNLVISIMVAIGVAENFGKGTAFGIGLAFLPIIFYPILAFGSATYGGAVERALPPIPSVGPAQGVPPAPQDQQGQRPL
jgi:ABC-type sulfate transport system permease subunit